MRLPSCLKEPVPFVAMVLIECGVVVMTMISKAAMNGGMSNFVFVVYYNTLGILLFLPFFLFHISRNKPPPLTLALLWRFFLIGICGKSSFLISYIGIGYSSPTLSAALGNLTPIFTFLLVIIFRMEKIDIRSPSTRAKSVGTIVTVSGACLVTFYKGAPIFSTTSPSTNLHSLLQSGYSNWILGGLFLVISQFLGSIWYILQTSTVKEEYRDQSTVVFFYVLFGTIQCAILGLIMERNPSAWTLHLDSEMAAIVYSAVFGTLIRNNVVTWCLNEKGPLYVVMFEPLQMVVAMIGEIMFLGDKLYIGSVVGSIIIAIGFYTVMWGVGRQAKEEDMVEDALLPECEASSPNTHTPLLLNYDRQTTRNMN